MGSFLWDLLSFMGDTKFILYGIFLKESVRDFLPPRLPKEVTVTKFVKYLFRGHVLARYLSVRKDSEENGSWVSLSVYNNFQEAF